MEITNANNLIEVELEKEENAGLGLNIVGGKDNQHIPGDSGIFITKIRPNTAAFRAKHLSEGDRIISVNRQRLTDVTHEEAVEVFRQAKGRIKLNVELKAEQTALDRIPDSIRSQSAMATVSGTVIPTGGDSNFAPARSSSTIPTSTVQGQVTDTSNDEIQMSEKNGSADNSVNGPQLIQTDSGDGATELKASKSSISDPPPPPTPTFESNRAAPFAGTKAHPMVQLPSTASLLVEDPRDSETLRSSSNIATKRDAKYYTYEIAYTLVGLAAATTIGYFIYKRIIRH